MRSTRFYLPLPVQVVAAVLLLLALMISWHIVHDLDVHTREVEQSAMTEATREMTLLQSTLEFALARQVFSQVRHEISARLADPGVLFLLAADDQGRVIAGDSREHSGRLIMDAIPPAFRSAPGLQPALQRAGERHVGSVTITPDGASLLSVYPLVLAQQQGEIRPSRVGVVVLGRDLTRVKGVARRWAQTRSLRLAISGVSLAVIFLIAAHLLVNRRVQKLVGASRAFAAGDLQARADLSGRDELASIGSAFDSMAGQVAEKQRQLERERQRFEVAALNASDLIYEMNVATGTIDWFGPVDQALGFEQGKFDRTAAGWIAILHPEDRPRVLEAFERDTKLGAPFCEEYRVVRADGQVRTWTDRGTLVKATAGSLWIGVTSDITERRAAEESARREQMFTASCLNSLPGIFYLFSEDGKFLRWNVNAERVSGYSSAEIGDMSALDFFLPADREKIQAGMAKAFEAGQNEVEADLLQKSGATVPYLFTAYRFLSDGRKYLLGLGLDLTERKQAEAIRSSLESRLTEAEKLEAIGTLAGGIAHDFNNILTGIIGNTELAQLDCADDHPAQEKLEEVLAASERARSLIRQILNFGRLRGVPHVPIQVHTVVRDVQKLLRASLPAMIDLEVNVPADLPPVLGDAMQLHQVLMNLGANAGHAMAESGGVLKIAARAVLRAPQLPDTFPSMPQGGCICLSVEDTGKGIPPELVGRIFDPFFTTKEQGTGLGLSVVRGIVRDHGGGIEVQSQPGAGTTFHLYLPCAPIPGAIPADSATKLHRHVMMVDDEPGILQVGCRVLERAGCTVETFGSPVDALDAFSLEPDAFDAVITDKNMPQQNGLELARQLLELRPGLPIILATGYTDKASRDTAESLGIRRVLMKPYSPRALVEALEQVC